MRNVMIGMMVGLMALSLVSATFAQDKQPQTKCPVMGRDINKDVHVDFQGQRVYFCCPMCVGKFKADPEKYMAKFAKDGVLLECVQDTCPVMGGKIKKDVFTDYKGRRVYFCCPMCAGKFKADPEKYLAKLEKGSASKDDKASGGQEMKMKKGKSGGCGGCG